MTCHEWFRVWELCHAPGFSGPQFVAWPDGRGLIDQPAVVVAVFDMIDDQVRLEREQETRRLGSG